MRGRDKPRTFEHDGVKWSVRRQPPVAVATVPPGGYFPTPPPSGLQFVSERGERRFLPLDYLSGLPSKAELATLHDAQLVEWLGRATLEK